MHNNLELIQNLQTSTINVKKKKDTTYFMLNTISGRSLC